MPTYLNDHAHYPGQEINFQVARLTMDDLPIGFHNQGACELSTTRRAWYRCASGSLRWVPWVDVWGSAEHSYRLSAHPCIRSNRPSSARACGHTQKPLPKQRPLVIASMLAGCVERGQIINLDMQMQRRVIQHRFQYGDQIARHALQELWIGRKIQDGVGAILTSMPFKKYCGPLSCASDPGLPTCRRRTISSGRGRSFPPPCASHTTCRRWGFWGDHWLKSSPLPSGMTARVAVSFSSEARSNRLTISCKVPSPPTLTINEYLPAAS